MFTFECKDMGMDCDFVANAASKQEVMDMAMAHAVEAHADVLQGLSTEETEAMNAKLTDVITETEEEDIIAEDITATAVMDGEEDEPQGEEEVEEVEGEVEAVAGDAVGDEAEGEEDSEEEDSEEEDSKEETTEVA
jgi:predicted small metal-binding protein